MNQYEKDIGNKVSKIIKHRCKIKSTYYYIQIYITDINQYQKINFLIKCKENNLNSILYKKVFFYEEIVRYNKNFNYFSSLDTIFTSISQSIQENKFSITNSIKCLSLTMTIYISKLKKFVNVNINLNKHKNLKPITMSKDKKNTIQDEDIKRAIIAIYDLRNRVNKIEKNQYLLNTTVMNNVSDIKHNINSINGIINTDNNYDNNIYNYDKFVNKKNNGNPINNYNNYNNYNKNISKKKKYSHSLDVNRNNDNTINDNDYYKNINNNNNDRNYNKFVNIKNTDRQGIKRNNNSNIYINNYTQLNNNNISNTNANNINESNINRNSLLGMSNIMKKSNDLESSTNNKDDKHKNKNNEKILKHKKKKKTKNRMKSKKSNNSVESQNNKSNFNYPNQSIGNVNDISSINKNNVQNEKIYQNITPEKNNNIEESQIKNRYDNNYNNRNMNGVNDISEISDYSKLGQKKHKNRSSSNNHHKSHNSKEKSMNVSSIKNDYSNEMNVNVYDNKGKNKDAQDKYKDKDKSSKRDHHHHHSYEKNKNKNRDSIDQNKEYQKIVNEKSDRNNENIIKDNNKKKYNSAERFKRSNKDKDDSDNVLESETNNQLSCICKEINKINNNNNITEDISRNNINNNNNNITTEISKNNINNGVSGINDEISKSNLNINNIKNDSQIQINQEKEPKITINNNINNNNNNNNNNINKSMNINSSIMNLSKISRISMHPREEIKKYVNSIIIFRKDELRKLKDKISNNNRKLHVFFDLLYRASVNGDKELAVRKSISDCFETLTLFYTTEGARFGVYIKRKEEFSLLKGRYSKEVPGSCFIVGLNNLVFYQIDQNKTSNENYKDILSFGRTFYLNKNGTHWMIFTPQNHFLGKKCIMGNGEGLFTNLNVEEVVGNSEYHIKEIEIFSVAIE